jgi:hypothetical protein
MDLSGIDCALWIPTLGLFTPDIENADLQYAVMRALNDWTAKEWSTEKRHLWCVTIPLKPKWAVAEIRRCHDLGATAVWMRPNVMLVEGRLGDCLANYGRTRHGSSLP